MQSGPAGAAVQDRSISAPNPNVSNAPPIVPNASGTPSGAQAPALPAPIDVPRL
jgi:hypothetical protein